MEKVKQETLEEAAEIHLQKWRQLNNIHLSNILHAERCKNDFIAGAKWQFDQNQEDINKLISIIEWYDNESDVRPDVEIFMWFEQFKKNNMEKQLFVINGYRIWAKTYDEALEHYNMIIKF